MTREVAFLRPAGVVIAASFFLDWTRCGAMQPMVQSAVRPELRSTAMALTEFVNGAFASVASSCLGSSPISSACPARC